MCNISGGLRLLRVELTENRFRWILHCRAASDALKTQSDCESKGARWVTLNECAAIESGQMVGVDDCWLRGEEPMKWFEYLSSGHPSFPLSEFVVAVSEKGAEEHRGRAAYRTTSDGRLVVLRRSTGQVAAFCDTSGESCDIKDALPPVSRSQVYSGKYRLPSTVFGPPAAIPERLAHDNKVSLAVDLLASFMTVPAPDCICGIQMYQRADGNAAFAAVFGVQQHSDDAAAPRIASEGDAAPNSSGLKWIAADSLSDEFERDCVGRLLQHRVMPRSALVHDMGYYPQLQPAASTRSLTGCGVA